MHVDESNLLTGCCSSEPDFHSFVFLSQVEELCARRLRVRHVGAYAANVSDQVPLGQLLPGVDLVYLVHTSRVSGFAEGTPIQCDFRI